MDSILCTIHMCPLFPTGITTLLTTCTIALTGREGIPKVTYSTALDIYLLMCFSFVFAALVEYAGVNYFTKTPAKECVEDSDEVSVHVTQVSMSFILIYSCRDA